MEHQHVVVPAGIHYPVVVQPGAVAEKVAAYLVLVKYWQVLAQAGVVVTRVFLFFRLVHIYLLHLVGIQHPLVNQCGFRFRRPAFPFLLLDEPQIVAGQHVPHRTVLASVRSQHQAEPFLHHGHVVLETGVGDVPRLRAVLGQISRMPQESHTPLQGFVGCFPIAVELVEPSGVALHSV